jgi:uncharacterized protein YutE (UPF0331/DUF86 family)
MTLPELSTVERKLEYLEEQLRILEPYRSESREKILESVEKRYTVERALQLSVEAILDASRLLVLVEGWAIPKNEPHALKLLSEHGVISKELSDRLLGAKGFRNVLVHEYQKIDPEKVNDYLQGGYPDLQEFAGALSGYLQKTAQEQ